VTAPPDSGFPPGVCRLWWARTSDLRPGHDALLGPADLARRSRMALEADRRRTTTAAVVVRTVLGAALGVPPADVGLDRTCAHCGGPHGPPRLPAEPDLHVSVSHAGGCVAVAVLRGAPVGVDVEEVDRVAADDLDDLTATVLAPEEQAALARVPAGRRAEAFATYWTRKEAAVKAAGSGITVPLDRLVVAPPSALPRVLRWDGGPGPVELHDLAPPAGFAGALAVLGAAGVVVEERDAGPLLAQTSRRLSGATTLSQR
jgi:4'-phosphopantetheinyl transferase